MIDSALEPPTKYIRVAWPPHSLTQDCLCRLAPQIRGHVTDELSSAQSSKYYDSFLRQTQTLQSPQFVPAWALPRASSDSGTPIVTSAAAGATISIAVPGLSPPESFTAPSSPWTTTSMTTASNGRAVHIVPRVKPVGPTAAHLTTVSGLEDTLVVVQVAGMSELGLCMQAVVTTLPSKGRLFAVSTGCTSPHSPHA